MNLRELHEYTGKLLAAGLAPTLPVTALVEGHPREIRDVEVLEGHYDGDASPKLIPWTERTGRMVALCPVGDDFSDVLSNPGHGCKRVDVTIPE
jgi:hypothetical protein